MIDVMTALTTQARRDATQDAPPETPGTRFALASEPRAESAGGVSLALLQPGPLDADPLPAPGKGAEPQSGLDVAVATAPVDPPPDTQPAAADTTTEPSQTAAPDTQAAELVSGPDTEYVDHNATDDRANGQSVEHLGIRRDENAPKRATQDSLQLVGIESGRRSQALRSSPVVLETGFVTGAREASVGLERQATALVRNDQGSTSIPIQSTPAPVQQGQTSAVPVRAGDARQTGLQVPLNDAVGPIAALPQSGPAPALSPSASILPPARPTATPAPVADQVRGQMLAMLQPAGEGQIEIRLDPPELGRVRITIEVGDGHVSAHLMPEREQTAELLRRHADALHRVLVENGFDSADMTFGQPEPEAKPSESGPTDPFSGQENGTTLSYHVADGRLDLRL